MMSTNEDLILTNTYNCFLQIDQIHASPAPARSIQ